MGRADETKQELEYFKSQNVRVIFLDIPTTQVDLSAMTDEMSIIILSYINDMLISFFDLISRTELKRKKKRQSEGIEAKKARGEWGDYGRPRKMPFEEFSEHYKRVVSGDIGSLALMRELENTIHCFSDNKNIFLNVLFELSIYINGDFCFFVWITN